MAANFGRNINFGNEMQHLITCAKILHEDVAAKEHNFDQDLGILTFTLFNSVTSGDLQVILKKTGFRLLSHSSFCVTCFQLSVYGIEATNPIMQVSIFFCKK